MPALPHPASRLRARDERGQTVVEFALVLPILLLLIFGAFDLSRAYSFANDVNQIAGERARAAAVGRAPDDVAAGTTTDAWNAGSEVARVDVQICLPSGSGEPGEPVRAVVTADQVGFVSGILDTVGAGTVTGTAEMPLEQPADGFGGC